MITVNETTTAMGGGLFVICLVLIGLTFDARSIAPWPVAVGSVVLFVVLAFTSFSLMHNNLNELFDIADQGITDLNDITSSSACGGVAQDVVNSVLSEKVQMIFECAQPVLDNREKLFATYAGSLAAVTFVLTFGTVRSPGYVMSIARLGSICLLIAFISLLCLSIIVEIYMSYKDQYATDIHVFMNTTRCCQEHTNPVGFVSCILAQHPLLYSSQHGDCLTTVFDDICGVSKATHQLWDLNSDTTQGYIIFALLSLAVAGSCACLILGHSKTLYPEKQVSLKEGLITFILFWGLVGLAAAIWQTAYSRMHLLWLVWLSPVVSVLLMGLIYRYVPTSQPNFSLLSKMMFSDNM